ncbi:patatin family protein [Paenibacillus sp. alder61]|uniref:Patatin family protein n=1 Tax=Paenibacillus faecis TaxID=862114 RepID=A0A5D0CYT5_9BACL|nr:MULTISPECIES: patatin family protein [Paenibacillus]MCA1291651.1 patatin family protein [Paenibacillus sp. alder61]TYA14890.1 patatin family protein [Paenibacillus faecis]
MPSLVLEGGTLRPIFSSGIMDALLDEGIMFPYCIGVSAGISNGISYISKQKRRNLEIMENYRNDPRYIGYRNFFKSRSLFGLDFIFQEIPSRLVPFDTETYRSYTGKVLVGVTNAHTGLPEYMDGLEADEQWTLLRATCAIPFVFPAIELNGQKYYDGGLADPIPVRKAIADGNEKHLIVLTQPKGYEKKLSKRTVRAARLLRRRFPKLEEVLLTRHKHYNETVALCEQLEREGQAILLRPEVPLDSFEKDIGKLRETCRQGYELAMKRMDEIRRLF